MNKLLLLFLLILSLLLNSCTHTTNQHEYLLYRNVPSGSKNNGVQLGACQAGLTITEEEYTLLDDMGITWLRNSIPWSRVEKEPGVWDFEYYDKYMDLAKKYNKKVLIVLAYDVPWIYKKGDKSRNITSYKLPYYLNYVQTIVKRYGSQAAGFEIWNEPNNNQFWKGKEKDFFELTRQTVDIIKQTYPEKPVAVGSILYNQFFSGESFLKKIINNGTLENADAVSFHPYGIFSQLAASRIATAKQLLINSGYRKEIWITEIGYPTGGLYVTRKSLTGQADYVVKTIVRLFAEGVNLITWFNLFDKYIPKDIPQNVSSESFFGLAYPDYSLKPSGISYRLLANELQGSVYVNNGIQLNKISPFTLESYRYNMADNSSSVILWSNFSSKKIIINGFKCPVTGINLRTGEQRLYNNSAIITINSEPMLIKGKVFNKTAPLTINYGK